ncbi:DUF1150 family protein [Sulfitobacter pseudonitzschiae]|uniref:DUF1150 family protein n=1 Tax=Pseudosulfitobacter pseudonitzschiae TaxID=1402135 RepID=A0A9Q2RV83_9RHOB|nr:MULTISPECIES: DUF1150 family protein [Roseobacteraceae]MBM2291971.1 DUF1150 family protein [Pseudosulfitobacter pseudonitzschiae]MBM2296889.1 DUF1150 family protein [Pseudosulfitobacter pseudonitzschiae]MBM2301803.1 DUF1150 family protein [Pseudosulfitobacter pseudonitzschiae]MBM2311585.1 DUF1150 family protein [Pseudosulfitobacter pseudonitzschiae]MBM2316499.1 DUF1150 family protein [Pseudosulfitobacter pseudonitzschiae]|tara:strand:+ start:147 stop:368 length:222 start_codon:yes stop_codon:yes gene_type:complete
METPFDTEPKSNIVYVKTIDVSDLPEDVQEQAEGLEHLYAVHDAQGTQLALVADRKMAFVLARQNDLAPQAVH